MRPISATALALALALGLLGAVAAAQAGADDHPAPAPDDAQAQELRDKVLEHNLGVVGTMAAIVGASFISEDLTCINVGVLIGEGHLRLWVGLLACFIGITLGDMSFYLIGRSVGKPLLAWGWVQRRLPVHKLDELGRWFDHYGWKAIIATRCLPGARLPVYLAAGALGQQAGRFVFWALLAALVWTPTLVLLAALVGPIIAQPFHQLLGFGWWSLAIGALLLFLVLKLLPRLLSRRRGPTAQPAAPAAASRRAAPPAEDTASPAAPPSE